MGFHRSKLVAGLTLAIAVAGLGQAWAATVPVTGNIAASTTWTSDNEYILTQPIYVTDGATLTIEGGTVIRGESESAGGANDPGALIITRGSKINAFGTRDNPIVFTDLLDNNVGGSAGTPPYDAALNALGLTGQWGGVILLGRTYVANGTPNGPDATVEIQVEGLGAAGGLGFYGDGGDDDDDSGLMSYVSIRYGGFNLSANNEINGLTLGAVGRETTLNNIEVFQNKDDGVEFFGGTVGVQNLIVANVGDDSIDLDEGYRGKGQFVLIVQGTPGADKSDKGGELDGAGGDDSQPIGTSHFYNVTAVGLGGDKLYADSRENTGMHIRDNIGFRLYNSAFLDFGGKPYCVEGDPADADSSGARFTTPITSGQCTDTNGSPLFGAPTLPTFCDTDAECASSVGAGSVCADYYDVGASSNQGEILDTSFWCFGAGPNLPSDATTGADAGCDSKDHYGAADGYNPYTAALGNTYDACGTALPIKQLDRFSSGNPSTPDPVTGLDPRPAAGSVLLTGATSATPNDGFFKPAGYRGAFSETDNWAGGWSTLARLGYFPPSGETILVSSDITVSETWSKDNTYILDRPIYVTNGATLTIEAGTVVRGQPESSIGANDPGALIISRGSKIDAQGTAEMPIVFTDLNDDNIGDDAGTPPYDSALNALSLTGQWGGLVVLGRTYVAKGTPNGPDATVEVQIEGLTAAGGLGLYGNGGDDDDDSGTIRYVSLRYGGFNLSAANEINGLTLGAVGRETDIDFVEVFQNKDDGIECFGGTVDMKNMIVANPGDDSLDLDEGYRGKGQFIFVVQGTPGADKSDKGGELDGAGGDDSQPIGTSHFYNVTMVGLGGTKAYTDSLENTAMHIRDNIGFRLYNSALLDFGGSPFCVEGDPADPDSSGARFTTSIASGQCTDTNGNPLFGGPTLPTFCDTTADCTASVGAGSVCIDYYDTGDSTFQGEVEDSSFWCFGGGPVIPSDAVAASAAGCDSKDHYGPADGYDPFGGTLDNTYGGCATPLPINKLERLALGGTNPDPITGIDPRPAAGSALLTTDRSAPSDGFFSPAAYRGAFSATDNWADGWSTLDRLGYFAKPEELVSSNVTTSATWTSDRDWVLDRPIYVTDGATLTIEPGTVVRGQPESSVGANDPGTLIVARGSKLNALGTMDDPIVFTDLNDDNIGDDAGTPPYDSALNALSLTGQWGGLVVLGRTYVAKGTPNGPDATVEVQIEGLTAAGGLGLYGNGGDDDDDSGTIRYVSLRYGGFNLSAANEINGLTLGAVGRETDIDFVEVFQNKDDGIECFGGTVDMKNMIVANPGDDSLDLDEGYRGKGQFIFVVQGTPGADKSDKGGELDGAGGDDSQPIGTSHFYNVTMVGLGGNDTYADSLENTAMHIRDNIGFRLYNSALLDFGGSPFCVEGDPADPDSSGARFTTSIASGQCTDTGGNPLFGAPTLPTFCDTTADCTASVGAGSVCIDYYDTGDSTFQGEVEDSSFWCFGGGPVIPSDAVAASAAGCDSKDHYGPADGYDPFGGTLDNTYGGCASPLPVNQLDRFPVPGLPDPITAIDPRPAAGSALLVTDRLAPADGFFDAALYRGAFSAGSNWAQKWSTLSRLDYFASCQAGVGAFPDVVATLSFEIEANKSTLSWPAPASGDDGVVYDFVRTRGFTSAAAGDFDNADCLEVDDSDRSAVDKQTPQSGEVFFYLVRAQNSCGAGSLGTDSDGVERSGTSCP